MAFKGQWNFVIGNPTTIIPDNNPVFSACFNDYINLISTGINGILH